jgi:hypothetical protein
MLPMAYRFPTVNQYSHSLSLAILTDNQLSWSPRPLCVGALYANVVRYLKKKDHRLFKILSSWDSFDLTSHTFNFLLIWSWY